MFHFLFSFVSFSLDKTIKKKNTKKDTLVEKVTKKRKDECHHPSSKISIDFFFRFEFFSFVSSAHIEAST
jgi:hypothetical protein